MNFQEIKNKLERKSPGVSLLIKKDLGYQVGNVLEEARLMSGLTQKQLGGLVGSYQSVIARIESGNRLPSLHFLAKMAAALGTYVIPPKFGFMEKKGSSSTSTLVTEEGVEDDGSGSIVSPFVRFTAKKINSSSYQNLI